MAEAEDVPDRMQQWLASLGRKEPTSEMMNRYMKYYNKQCDRLCCHAFRCSTINCRSCAIQIQRAHRLVCMHPECSPDEHRETLSTGYYLCQDCFNSPERVVHPMQLGEPHDQHTEWCRISWPDGVHTVVRRETSNAGSVAQLTMDDLPLLSDEAARCRLCPICGDEDWNPDLCTWPNCRAEHGYRGLQDNYCRECLFQTISHQTEWKLLYAGPISQVHSGYWCDQCQRSSREAQLESDFKELLCSVDAIFEGEENGVVKAEVALALLSENLAKEGITLELFPEANVSRVELIGLIRDCLKHVHGGDDQVWIHNIAARVFDVADSHQR